MVAKTLTMSEVSTPQQKSIFAIISNQTSQYLTSNKFFLSQEAARARLKKMAEERKYNLGVYHFEQTEDSFSFVLGWENHDVRFTIVELPVEG
jgi:hypothetical protein